MAETSPRSPSSWIAAWRFAVGMLSILPARVGEVDRRLAGRGMLLAPFVGLLLGLIAAVTLVAGQRLYGYSLLAPAFAVGSLALLTRGLHLDGLADLADGLGSRKPAEPALQIMKRSDIGPFGVVTLVFTLLIQVAALSQMPATGALALITACVTGRLAVTWACREGVPAARPNGLGALVAGTVRRGAAIATTLTAVVVVAFPAFLLLAFVVMAAPWPASGQPPTGLSGLAPSILVCPIAIAAGLGAAASLRRRAERRLGGITGDVLGALVETATTVALLVCALVLP